MLFVADTFWGMTLAPSQGLKFKTWLRGRCVFRPPISSKMGNGRPDHGSPGIVETQDLARTTQPPRQLVGPLEHL